jgi:tellurite resistance protein TerC
VLHSIVSPLLLWMGLLVVLGTCLAVDLWAHRRPHDIPLADAARWTAGWVGLALACAVGIWLLMGGSAFLQFLAGYAVEWSLSIDNVFVFVVVIAALAVPGPYRHRVLFFGSLGAIVLRLTFILAGTALLNRFGWLTYVFGALLLVAAMRFALERDADEPDQVAEPGVGAFLRRWLPVGPYDGGRLTTVAAGRRLATPLLLALLLVAITDVMFATDSIPAVFAMTRNPFLAVSSNALAVVGLRWLYFLLEGVMLRFRFLKPALVLLLALVSAKMMAAQVLDVPVALSLIAIVVILGGAALASWVAPRVVPSGGGAPQPGSATLRGRSVRPLRSVPASRRAR